MMKKDSKEALQEIKKGILSGTARPYQRPQFEERNLYTMLMTLSSIDLFDWYHYAFSREPLNGKFTEEQRKDFAKQAIACGKEYYERICKQYHSDEPTILAEKMNMQVTYPSLPKHANRVLFAEYREPNHIHIYMDAVEKAEELLNEPSATDLIIKKSDIKKLLLAHELFHHIEELHKEEIYSRTEKIRLWSLGPLHNDSTIRTLSEMAAMSFAKELAKVSYAPYLMDILLVYGYSNMEASGLYEEMMTYF